MTHAPTYAALSYCWGTEKDASTQFKTTTGTLAKRCKGMPLSDMSQVMRDAIAVCRSLLIPYLWVDAVCILQDNRADWEVESQQMGKIYAHATVTICAASTTSCHASFLDRQRAMRYPRLDIPFTSTIEPNIQGTFSLWDRTGPRTVQFNGHAEDLKNRHFVKDALFLEVLMSSWATRGWVYQERHLSTRMLLCGESFVHFHCPRGPVSESGLQLSKEFETLFLERRDGASVEGGLPGWTIYDRWRELVSIFSATALTKSVDRFPALSGLASFFSDISGDKYIAGIWKMDLPRGLLWVREQPSPPDFQTLLRQLLSPDVYVAPSWSWASQTGACSDWVGKFKIDFDASFGHGRRSEVQHMHARSELDGPNIFGRIRSGSICLRGKTVPVSSKLAFVADSGGWTAWKLMHGSKYIAHCALDWRSTLPEQEPDKLEMLMLMSACSNTDLRWNKVDDDGDEGHETGGEVSAELAAAAESAQDICDLCKLTDHNRHAWGLLLHPSEEPGVFFRVGLFTSRARTPSGRHFGTNLFLEKEFRDIEIR